MAFFTGQNLLSMVPCQLIKKIICRDPSMSIKRYGTVQTGAGGKPLPFARAVEADGWLYVSGQVAMENGEIIDGNIVAQAHKTIQNVIAILKEAGYGLEHVVRCGVWLDDPR